MQCTVFEKAKRKEEDSNNQENRITPPRRMRQQHQFWNIGRDNRPDDSESSSSGAGVVELRTDLEEPWIKTVCMHKCEHKLDKTNKDTNTLVTDSPNMTLSSI